MLFVVSFCLSRFGDSLSSVRFHTLYTSICIAKRYFLTFYTHKYILNINKKIKREKNISVRLHILNFFDRILFYVDSFLYRLTFALFNKVFIARLLIFSIWLTGWRSSILWPGFFPPKSKFNSFLWTSILSYYQIILCFNFLDSFSTVRIHI